MLQSTRRELLRTSALGFGWLAHREPRLARVRLTDVHGEVVRSVLARRFSSIAVTANG